MLVRHIETFIFVNLSINRSEPECATIKIHSKKHTLYVYFWVLLVEYDYLTMPIGVFYKLIPCHR